MVRKIKKAREKELEKPDEFITFFSKIAEYIGKNKKQVLSAGSVILIVILAVTGFLYYSAKMERKAAAILSQGTDKYEKAMQTKTPQEAYKEVTPDFNSFLENYSGKKSGHNARLIYANICYNGGDYDKAITLLEQGLEDFETQPFISSLILNSLGFAYEAKKDLPKAIEYFEKAVSNPEAAMKDEAFFHIGAIYSEMEKPAKSEEAFKKIISDNTDSIFIDVVREKVTG